MRGEALTSWRAEPALSRDDAVARLIAAIRGDRETLWKFETDEYQEARSDAGFDNSAAQGETRDRVEMSDRVLAAVLQEEVDRATAEVRNRESLLRLGRLIVRQCQGWRYGGWGYTPVFRFLDPALGWAERSADDAPPEPWAFFASFLVAGGCPVAAPRDAAYFTSSSPRNVRPA